MSINHLIDIDTQPKYDIYVNNILSRNNIKIFNRVTANRFALASVQEIAVGDSDTNKYLFGSNLSVSTPSQPWVTLNSVSKCKMTRDKLHWNPETNKLRKVFNFDIVCSLTVDYSLRAGQTVIDLSFICAGFPNFVPFTPLDDRINDVVFAQGNFSTYSATTPSGVSGNVKCFISNIPNVEGFTAVLLPIGAFPTTGTEPISCQFSCSLMDSEELDLNVLPT